MIINLKSTSSQGVVGLMSSTNDLPSSVTSYKPQILKIKIGPFRSWIEKRLTELLEGLEDEILWGLVFNYLEDAQKRSKREGPASNPSGGLNAKEIQTALSGFLGPKNSRDFTTELFELLAKAEANDNGIPPEFNMKPEEAENEAFGIIQSKRKEMELSDRVKREIKRTDYHNRGRDNYSREDRKEREYEQRERDHRRRDYDRKRDYSLERDYDYRRPDRSDRRNRNYSRSPEKSSCDRHRDRYEEDRRRQRDDSRDRNYRDEYARRRDYNPDNDHDREIHDDRRRDYRHSRSRDSPRRRSPSKSPIPSSSPESSPSPCWETTLDTARAAAPRAPVAQEHVSNELEQALKARALKALVEKRN